MNTVKPELLFKEDVLDRLYREYNSYGRLGGFFDILPLMSRSVRWQVLGEIWENVDNLAEYASELEALFNGATREDLNQMMTPSELSTWQELPGEVVCFRGCFDYNADGRSYTLDRNIAIEFTRFNRYRHLDKIPLVITAKISKRYTFFKNGRGEQEIVSLSPLHLNRLNEERL